MSAETLLSIVLPTRGRRNLVDRLLDNLAETAQQPDRLEVVLYLDRDDEPSHAVQHGGLKLTKIIGPRAKMGVMSRACQQAAAGRHVMLLNDDVVCRTAGWDTAVVGAFERFPDGIALVWCNDLCRGAAMASFPAVSRRACELMGGICPADYNRDYIDTHLFDIFRKLAALGHNRLVFLRQVVLEHMHHEVGKADLDETYRKVRQSADELAFIAWEEQRQIIAEDLVRHIEASSACVLP